MSKVREPIHNVTHLGHIELLTPKLAESFWFFDTILAALRPALKNQPQRYTDYGVGVHLLDHSNFFGHNPISNRSFLQEHLGVRLTQQIILDDGIEAGSWHTFTNKTYDVVYTKDAMGTAG